MIKQAAIGLNSRREANPFNEDGFLPLITAPMSCVVDHTNSKIFFDNKIQVCLPRGEWDFRKENEWCAVSLEEFNTIVEWKEKDIYPKNVIEKICIDTANGNMPALHDAIRKAKEIHGDNLIIMAGNVASVEAFIELAKTGVDYIRVGIGGGGGCNTTSNTGVGQEDLEILISQCKYHIATLGIQARRHEKNWQEHLEGKRKIDMSEEEYFNRDFYKIEKTVGRVKIVADGISSYIKRCQDIYGFNDNGYAAINKLLFAGADLVMIGKLFAQCLESAGEKRVIGDESEINSKWLKKDNNLKTYYKCHSENIEVKYSGMSTHVAQRKYKQANITGYDVYRSEDPMLDGIGFVTYTQDIKPSEGSVQWIPVRWTLDEWLNGNATQDEYPYLMGWVNSIKSAMAYTGKNKL